MDEEENDMSYAVQLHETLKAYIEKREKDLLERIERNATFIVWAIKHKERWGNVMDAARRSRECVQRLDELAMLRAAAGLGGIEQEGHEHE